MDFWAAGLAATQTSTVAEDLGLRRELPAGKRKGGEGNDPLAPLRCRSPFSGVQAALGAVVGMPFVHFRAEFPHSVHEDRTAVIALRVNFRQFFPATCAVDVCEKDITGNVEGLAIVGTHFCHPPSGSSNPYSKRTETFLSTPKQIFSEIYLESSVAGQHVQSARDVTTSRITEHEM